MVNKVTEMIETPMIPAPDVTSQLNEVDNAFSLFRGPSAHPPNESEKKRKYKAVVVEGHGQVRDMLVECLRFSGFEAEGYYEGEFVLGEILQDTRQVTLPDLFVIDLELQAGKVCGMSLIEQLTDNNIPSAIMAMSQNLSGGYLIEAMKTGAEDVVHKPFDVFQIMERMENLARIGRNRQLYRQHQLTNDDSRQNRPVFLSYSNKDKRIASVLRSHIEARGIGVWYAPDSLQPGDAFRRRILDAIDRAHVFVPLITDSYPNSPFCMAELVRFYRRLRTDRSPVLLPVLHGSPEEMENFDWIKPIMEEHQYADITSERFVNGLTALLGRIQKAVSQHQQV
jgi:DNA-binding response OmpR family regulator